MQIYILKPPKECEKFNLIEKMHVGGLAIGMFGRLECSGDWGCRAIGMFRQLGCRAIGMSGNCDVGRLSRRDAPPVHPITNSHFHTVPCKNKRMQADTGGCKRMQADANGHRRTQADAPGVHPYYIIIGGGEGDMIKTRSKCWF